MITEIYTEVAEQLKHNADWWYLVNKALLCNAYVYGNSGRAPIRTLQDAINLSVSDRDNLPKLLEIWFRETDENLGPQELVDMAISNLACIIALDCLADKLSKTKTFSLASRNTYADVVIETASGCDTAELSGDVYNLYLKGDLPNHKSNEYITISVSLSPLNASTGKKYLDRDCTLYIAAGLGVVDPLAVRTKIKDLTVNFVIEALRQA